MGESANPIKIEPVEQETVKVISNETSQRLTRIQTSMEKPTFKWWNVITKRAHAPNLSVARKICDATCQENKVERWHRAKKRFSGRRSPHGKKGRQVIQTQGVFSTGMGSDTKRIDNLKYGRNLATGKVTFNSKNETNECDEIKGPIDDIMPDLSFTPLKLPFSGTKPGGSRDVDQVYEFLQSQSKILHQKDECGSLLATLDNISPKLVLFEFPKTLNTVTNSNKPGTSERLSEVGNLVCGVNKGLWGHLRIHENGKVYLASANSVMSVSLSATNMNKDLMLLNNHELVNLGMLSSTYSCSTNFSGT